MTTDEARGLIERAVPAPRGTWADLGAGTGTFTLALAEVLGPLGAIYAVERDQGALESLGHLASADAHDRARIELVHADFNGPLELPPLTGILAANALHFVARADQAALLARLASMLDAGGRIVIVEYDRDRGNPWVPYPISRARLIGLARDARLGEPEFFASMPSQYGGELYSALLLRTA